MGIGTLIVFIAMILVAAVAAAVLIETSGALQQRASETGSQALSQASSNFEITGVYGARDTTSGPMENLTMHLQLSPGATDMDLSQLTIRYTDGASLRTNLTWFDGTGTGTFDKDKHFRVTILRDVAGTYSAGDPVIGQGDLVEIKIEAVNLDTRTNVHSALNPETGSAKDIEFRTPSTYGTSKYVQFK